MGGERTGHRKFIDVRPRVSDPDIVALDHNNAGGIKRFGEFDYHDGCWRIDDDNATRWIDDDDLRLRFISPSGGTGTCSHGADADARKLDEPELYHHCGGLEHRLGIQMRPSAG